jgi:hypothetical protein
MAIVKLLDYDSRIVEIEIPENIPSLLNLNKFDIPVVIIWNEKVFVQDGVGAYHEVLAYRVPTTGGPSPIIEPNKL